MLFSRLLVAGSKRLNVSILFLERYYKYYNIFLRPVELKNWIMVWPINQN
jgi:hypothetical protein